jgi:hypothetical protein
MITPEGHRQKLALKTLSLREDFDHFLEISKEGKELEKHHTQIKRIVLHFEGFFDLFKTKLDAAQSDAEFQKLRRLILGAHEIWHFFREKFLTRESERYHRLLKLADEYAWECLQPLLPFQAPDKGREPPLIYFSAKGSPAELSRGKCFQGLLPNAQSASLSQLTMQLPVPVISLPWYQSLFLPEWPVIAHEVGHIVENDFQLTDSLKSNLKKSCHPARLFPWTEKWLGEAFADVYGTMTGGPAFVRSLIMFITDRAKAGLEIQSEDDGFEIYPTTALRALLCCSTLEHMGFTSSAKEIREDYAEILENHRMKNYEDDLPKVVRAFIDSPLPSLGDKSLRSIERLAFDQNDLKCTAEITEDLREGFKIGPGKARQYLSSVTAFFETNPGDLTAKLTKEVIDRAVAEITAGTRSHPMVNPDDPGLRKTDQEMGRQLFHALEASQLP